jgi:hypothetical protein
MNARDVLKEAQRQRAQIHASELAAASDDFQELLQQALGNLDTCSALMRSLHLFSNNESLQDLTNDTLRFMLVDAYRGALVQLTRHDDRIHVLSIAEACYEAFLELCSNYELITAYAYPLHILLCGGRINNGGRGSRHWTRHNVPYHVMKRLHSTSARRNWKSASNCSRTTRRMMIWTVRTFLLR